MSRIVDLAREAADVLRLQRPETLFAGFNEGDLTDRLLLRALTQSCRYLAGWDWSALKADHRFEALAQEEQTGKMPADFLRIVDETVWNATLARPVDGPLSDEERARARSSVTARVTPAYYLAGKKLYLAPSPAAGHVYTLTYIRNAIGTDSDGAYVARFSHDSDMPLWDDELMVLGAVYQYRKNERLDYAQDEIDFKIAMHDALKRDGGARRVNMKGTGDSADDMVRRMKTAAIVIS